MNWFGPTANSAMLLLMALLLPAAALAEPDRPNCGDSGGVFVREVYAGGPGTPHRPRGPVNLLAGPRPERPDPVPVELRDTISVVVEGLKALTEEQQCRQDGSAIVLFLDGRPVPGAAAYPPSDTNQGTLHFELRRSDRPTDSEASERLWTHVLGRPAFGTRELPVSVGLSTRHAVPSDSRIALRVIPLGWFAFWFLIFAGSLWLFARLGRHSDVLRATTPAPLSGRRPYSLSRAQAAWWFFLALAAYLFIAIVTGQWNTGINNTVLGLLVIASGTTLGSVAIDSGKETSGTQESNVNTAASLRDCIATLEAKKGGLETTASDPGTAPEQAAQARAQLVEVQRQLEESRSALAKAQRKSEGVFIDMVSDANGVSFHRFQLLVLTVVLGVVFVHGVWRDLAMPEFSEQMLGLLGLSSLSYLGLKVPEPNVPRKANQTATAAGTAGEGSGTAAPTTGAPAGPAGGP